MSRVRAWCFTLNNYTEDEYANLKLIPVFLRTKYLILGREVGACGTPHIQGFVYFENNVSFATLKRYAGDRCHIEMKSKFSTFEQCAAYCKKDNDFYEFGSCPLTQMQKGQMEKDRYEIAWTLAKSGNWEAIDPQIRIKHYSSLKNIHKDNLPKVADESNTTGVWIWGESGVGKSRYARETYPDYYDKPCNKWWDGYQDQPNVLIDDLGKEHSVLGHHLKRWADRYSFLAEIKGGAIQIRPRKIVITSQYSIEEVFVDRETQDAIRRRFEVIHMSNPFRVLTELEH